MSRPRLHGLLPPLPLSDYLLRAGARCSGCGNAAPHTTSSLSTAGSSTAPAPRGLPQTSEFRAGHVAAIGRLDKGRGQQRIDAAGRVVCARVHRYARSVRTHASRESHVPSKIFQGITTEITGEGNPSRLSMPRSRGKRHPDFDITGLHRTGLTFRDISRGYEKQERHQIGTYRRRDDGTRDGDRIRRPCGDPDGVVADAGVGGHGHAPGCSRPFECLGYAPARSQH